MYNVMQLQHNNTGGERRGRGIYANRE